MNILNTINTTPSVASTPASSIKLSSLTNPSTPSTTTTTPSPTSTSTAATTPLHSIINNSSPSSSINGNGSGNDNCNKQISHVASNNQSIISSSGSNYSSISADGRIKLLITSQPEEQHRARYLTEGSRGAIKDSSGLSHPQVKLFGYTGSTPLKLECFIGQDKNEGIPHLFYQASKISGKNSTQCTSCRINGTSVIIINLLPENGMQATIDCVGILKERNVDVEQKLANLNKLNNQIITTNNNSEKQLTSTTTPTTNSPPVDFVPAFNSINNHNNNAASSPSSSVSVAAGTLATTTTSPTFNGAAPLTNGVMKHQVMNYQQPLLQQHQQQQQNNSRLTTINHQQISPFQLTNGNSFAMSATSRQLLQEVAISQSSNSFMPMDENSFGSRSHAESSFFDDCSQDVSRHSVITYNHNHHHHDSCSIDPLDNKFTTRQPSSTGEGQSGWGPFRFHAAGATSATGSGGATGLMPVSARKRSVRCRLVFRVKLPETGEILQTTSSPIICTQPLGTPEISKKSLDKINITASNDDRTVNELFIIGKNFLKDAKVIFQCKQFNWIRQVDIDKEFFNSSHLICKIPKYDGPDQYEIIEAEVQVISGGKLSEGHSFLYINDRLSNRSACNSNGDSNTNEIEHLHNQQQNHNHKQQQQQLQQQQHTNGLQQQLTTNANVLPVAIVNGVHNDGNAHIANSVQQHLEAQHQRLDVQQQLEQQRHQHLQQEAQQQLQQQHDQQTSQLPAQLNQVELITIKYEPVPQHEQQQPQLSSPISSINNLQLEQEQQQQQLQQQQLAQNDPQNHYLNREHSQSNQQQFEEQQRQQHHHHQQQQQQQQQNQQQQQHHHQQQQHQQQQQQQQQQQMQQAIIEQQMHQQQQQQQQQHQQIQGQLVSIQPRQTQLISSVDLNDDTTVIYSDSFQTQSNDVMSIATNKATVMNTNNMPIQQQLEQISQQQTIQLQVVEHQQQVNNTIQNQHIALDQNVQQPATLQQGTIQYQQTSPPNKPDQRTSPFELHQANQQQQQLQQSPQGQRLSPMNQQQIQQITLSPQQQQVHHQLINELNDDGTVIYSHDMITSNNNNDNGNGMLTNTISNVGLMQQTGTIMGNIDCLNDDTCMSVTATPTTNTLSYYSGVILS